MNVMLLKYLDSRPTQSPLSNKNGTSTQQLLKTILLIFLLSSILIGESTVPTPCRSHGGPAGIDEGSGICTGNFETVIPFLTIGFALHHNSASPGIVTSSGISPFGIGFSLSVESWFTKISATTGKIINGNGSEISYAKDLNSERWYPVNILESNHWLEFTSAHVLEKSLDGLEIKYVPNPAVSNSYSVQSYKQINGRGLTITRSNNRITRLTSDNGRGILINYIVNPPRDKPNVEIKDFLSNVYGLFIDSTNHLTKIVFPDNRQQLLSYVGDRISSITHPNGDVLRIDYNSSGALSQLIHPDGLRTQMSYTASTVSSVHPRQESTETFDNERRLISSSFNGQRTTLERDSLGQVIRLTNPLGLVTQFNDYGLNRLPSRIIRSDGAVENYIYNSDGNVTQLSTLINGRTTTTNIEYNSLSLPTKISSSGQFTEYTYDDKGYVTQINSSLLGIIYRGTYDLKGNLLTATDENGLVTRYTYNSSNYLTRIEYPTGKTQSLAPDALGRNTLVGVPLYLNERSTYSDAGGTNTKLVTQTSGSPSVIPISERKSYTPRNDGGGTSIVETLLGPNAIFTEETQFDKKGRIERSSRR